MFTMRSFCVSLLFFTMATVSSNSCLAGEWATLGGSVWTANPDGKFIVKITVVNQQFIPMFHSQHDFEFVAELPNTPAPGQTRYVHYFPPSSIFGNYMNAYGSIYYVVDGLELYHSSMSFFKVQ